MFKKLLPCLLILAFQYNEIFSQKIYNKSDRQKREHWVDSVFQSMTHEERLGQLFMVAAYSPVANSRCRPNHSTT